MGRDREAGSPWPYIDHHPPFPSDDSHGPGDWTEAQRRTEWGQWDNMPRAKMRVGDGGHFPAEDFHGGLKDSPGTPTSCPANPQVAAFWPESAAFCSPPPQRYHSFLAHPPAPLFFTLSPRPPGSPAATPPSWALGLQCIGHGASSSSIHTHFSPRSPWGAALLCSVPHLWGCDFGLLLAWGASDCPAAVGRAPGKWPYCLQQCHLESYSHPAAQQKYLHLHWPAPSPGTTHPLQHHPVWVDIGNSRALTLRAEEQVVVRGGTGGALGSGVELQTTNSETCQVRRRLAALRSNPTSHLLVSIHTVACPP